MTPQERQLIDDLFDRLASLESAPRDPEAAAAIAQGLRRAPNATYALVQTVLVQDEALKRANARIQELEDGATAPSGPHGGFLDSMRDAVFGQGQPQGSVPNVRPPSSGTNRPVWNSGQVLGSSGAQEPYPMPQQGPPPQQTPGGGGGSFLGTAAAAAAGTVGGSLLLGGIRSMMGGGSHQAFGDSLAGRQGGGPWGSDQSNSSLARDAGLNDIGSGSRQADAARAGQFDQAQADADQDQDQDQDQDDEDDRDYAGMDEHDDFDDGYDDDDGDYA